MSSTKEFLKTGKFPEKAIRPVGDRILVKRDEKEGQSKGGIVLPENAKQKPSKGTIMAVGSGRLLENGQRVTPSVKEGDRVFFSKWAGMEHPNDETLVFVKEEDIQAVL